MASKDRSQMREDHPDSWIAVEAGDTLVGVLVDADRAWSDVKNGGEGGFYPLLVVAPTDATGYNPPPEELRVHCFGAVLVKEVLKCRPEIGETVEFVYRGTSSKEPRKGFSAPELYSVRVPGRPVNAGAIWDSMAYPLKQTPTPPLTFPLKQTPTPPRPADEDIPF